jgi:phytoene dehydrogenase-like protein
LADPDAVVVGSGPNGLVAALTLAEAGRTVLVVEAADRPGGALRSDESTLPGVVHDRGAAVLGLALASPALRDRPWAELGVEWSHPEVALAHPLDGRRAVALAGSVDDTAAGLGEDADAYRRLVGRLADHGADLVDALLAPLTVPPRHPLALARFGITGLRSADAVARRRFRTDEARALFGGLAAHSVLSLRSPVTAGHGLVLALVAHLVGWPVVRGGTERLAEALTARLVELGGRVECGRRVASIDELPPAASVVLDLTPRQVVAVAGHRLPDRYRRRLERWRYGPGVFKVDWALDGPVPWVAEACARAGTVHVGGPFAEIAAAEDAVQAGGHPERPFVLFVQPSVCDPTRAPAGVHVGWAYCHVPNGSTVDMTEAIERRIEQFAPGFRDRILGRHAAGPAALEADNPNLVGGDIGGGRLDLRQFLARPVASLRPWRAPVDGLYLCSSSTPPGGGAHGMAGLHAARTVLHDT